MKYPGAIWRPGPDFKQNGGTNTVKGVVCHSMVGYLAAALGELDKVSRRASWHFSVCQDGTVYQHYDTSVQAWHAGSAYNNDTVGIEHEGGFDPTNEPLTLPQLNASVNLVRWLAQAHHFAMERRNGLWEHHEVSGEPTSCPSGRIPWEHYTDEPEPQEENMPKVVYNTNDKKIYLVGYKAPIWITDTAELAALEKAYGTRINVTDATMKQMVL